MDARAPALRLEPISRVGLENLKGCKRNRCPLIELHQVESKSFRQILAATNYYKNERKTVRFRANASGNAVSLWQSWIDLIHRGGRTGP